MTPSAQAKFKRRVKVWLASNDLNVTELARRIGRRRDSVSVAIHQGRFPHVRQQIEEEMSK